MCENCLDKTVSSNIEIDYFAFNSDELYENDISNNAAVVNSSLGNAGNYSNDYINGIVWGGGWSGTVYYTIDQGEYGGDGWNGNEVTAIQNAVDTYNNVCGIDIQYVTPGNASVDIIFATVNNASLPGAYGVHEVPDGTDSLGLGGAEVCYGLYNWELFSADADSFDIGGFDYITLIHELGHGLGLAHPHDDGGSSSTYSGVSSSMGDFGDNNVNQGIFTTMSYNDGWVNQFSSHTINNGYAGYGYQGTPMAFDIAALQDLYGANNNYQTGNNTYSLPTVNGDNQNTYWSCIWDASGTDTISNSGSSIACTINLNAASLTGANAGGYVSWNSNIVGGYTIANGVVIENATGGSGDDTITGNSANNILDGGAGDDTMVGGAGDDTYYVDSASDVVTESSGEGTDTIKSSGFSLELANYDNVENLELTGSSNLDLTGDGNDNTLTGNDGNNTLTGGAGDDTMVGGAGDDTLYGNAGEDTMYGGTGDDTMWGYFNNDLMYGGDGADTIYGVKGADTIYGEAGNDWINASGNVDIVYGGAGDDYIKGHLGNDTLYGGDGDDTIDGNEGTDTVYGNAGNDTIKLHYGPDVAYGGDGNDTILGYKGFDDLYGGAGNDTLKGGNGRDELYGEDGLDTLYGGANPDTFYFHSNYISDNNVDIIMDMEGADTINLADLDANSSTSGDQAFNWIGTASFSGTAGELQYAVSGGTYYLQGDVDGDGSYDFQIDLQTFSSLNEGDLVL